MVRQESLHCITADVKRQQASSALGVAVNLPSEERASTTTTTTRKPDEAAGQHTQVVRWGSLFGPVRLGHNVPFHSCNNNIQRHAVLTETRRRRDDLRAPASTLHNQ